MRSGILPIVIATILGCAAFGQTAPAERTYAAPKPEIEKALASLQATGGRLPTVDGFIASQDLPQDRLQRPRYTYSVQVLPKASGSIVRVRTRITAWFAGPTPAQSGYRELPSNGRLEADLFERLEDSLAQKSNSRSPVQDGVFIPTNVSPPRLPQPNPLLAAPRPSAVVLPPRTAVEAAPASNRGSENYAQGLREQAKNLEEVLRNQTHPTDLAAVRKSKTPVYSRPSEQGDVLFLAEAQDEFQILNTSSEWVHVQISGLSRGWIRGPDVELPVRAAASAKPVAAKPPPTVATSPTESQPFRLARQEVNNYPGDWAALRGKSVRILSLAPTGTAATTPAQKWETAQFMFHRAAARLAAQPTAAPQIEGVVLIFDSADGGMVSTTVTPLRQWDDGHLSDEAFRAQCSFDPAEAFRSSE